MESALGSTREPQGRQPGLVCGPSNDQLPPAMFSPLISGELPACTPKAQGGRQVDSTASLYRWGNQGARTQSAWGHITEPSMTGREGPWVMLLLPVSHCAPHLPQHKWPLPQALPPPCFMARAPFPSLRTSVPICKPVIPQCPSQVDWTGSQKTRLNPSSAAYKPCSFRKSCSAH